MKRYSNDDGWAAIIGVLLAILLYIFLGLAFWGGIILMIVWAVKAVFHI